ncbi:MAG: MFS transporter [Promethearchaeota archaeon]
MESETQVNSIVDSDKSKNFSMYLQFWAGQIISLLGSSIVMFAIIWELSEMRPGDNTIISLAFFFGFLPQIIISPFAGVVADKFDKKKIILISDSLQALFTLVLIFSFMLNRVTVAQILVINFLRGTAQAFHSPISFTLIPLMVPNDKMTRINGLNFLFNSMVNIIGPVVGAWLLVLLPVGTILWVDIVTFGIALIPLLRIKIPKVGVQLESEISFEQDSFEQDAQETQNGDGTQSIPDPIPDPIPNSKEKISYFTEIREGIKLIGEIPGMVGALVMAVFLNFIFMPFDALLINFIKVTHSGTAWELGIFSGAIQVGMFGGAIIVSVIKKWKNWTFWVSFGLIVQSIAFLALGFIPDGMFWLLYITGGIMLLMNPIINSLFQTTIQNIVPPEKMGRIMALIMMFAGIASPIGLLIAGPIADAIGSIKWVFIGCGILTLMTSSLAVFGKDVHTLLSQGETLANETA